MEADGVHRVHILVVLPVLPLDAMALEGKVLRGVALLNVVNGNAALDRSKGVTRLVREAGDAA